MFIYIYYTLFNNKLIFVQTDIFFFFDINVILINIFILKQKTIKKKL